MIKFTTASGATYFVDGLRVRRDGPESPLINYAAYPDGDWHKLSEESYPIVGESCVMYFGGGKLRITTAVTSIEEISNEQD